MLHSNDSNTRADSYSYPQKVWIAGAIFALIAVLLLLLQATFSVLLLVLAGTLIAIFFRALAALIQRKMHWKQGLCLFISIASTLIITGLLLWLVGAKVQSQTQELSDILPETISHAKTELGKSAIGEKIIRRMSSPGARQQVKAVAKTFFKSTFGILGDLYVVLFIGMFFTAAPGVYRNGIIRLIPPPGKKQAENILKKMGGSLAKWLKGKLFAMLVVFILTSIGLNVIGVRMWLVLALIAGILNFIPNFGPLIALIPAILVGLMHGPATAAWVAGLYIAVQVAESNFITPLVQQKLVNIPPAMIIIVQLLIAPLTGGWGLVLATPVLVIVIILVQELYIKKQRSA